MIYQRLTLQPRRCGFTLIELVVVIAIILLLLGLTLSAGLAIRKQSEVRETENILRLLDTAMQEWQRIAERPLSWGLDNTPFDGATYDLQGGVDALYYKITPEILIITELLKVIKRPDPIRDIIAQIDSAFIYRYKAGQYPAWIQSPHEKSIMDTRFAGEISALDAWGWPIYATHPGRVSNPDLFPEDSVLPDDDGTVVTDNERIYGTSINRTVVFVSAGPDGNFGDFRGADDSPEFEKTKDNIFSTAIDR